MITDFKPIDSMSDLGAIIRERRKSFGYTQEYLAAFCGMSPRLIGEIENGRPTVGFQRVVDVAMTLGIDLFAKER